MDSFFGNPHPKTAEKTDQVADQQSEAGTSLPET